MAMRAAHCGEPAAGAAHFLPAGISAVSDRIVDGKSAIWIPIECHVGGAARAGILDIVLEGGLIFDLAVAARCAAPGGFGSVGAAGGEGERGAADGHNVGRTGRPKYAAEAAAIAGGGDKGNALVAAGRGEERVVLSLAREFAL